MMLNDELKVNDIAKKLNINAHRIYDAISENKLYYPDSYIKNNQVPVVQLNMNKDFVAEFINYHEAERKNNITHGLIGSAIFNKSYYTSGFYWVPKKLYESNNYSIPKNRLEKFYVTIDYVGNDNKIIEKYENCFIAASIHNTIASKIYNVAIGNRKTYKGKRFVILT